MLQTEAEKTPGHIGFLWKYVWFMNDHKLLLAKHFANVFAQKKRLSFPYASMAAHFASCKTSRLLFVTLVIMPEKSVQNGSMELESSLEAIHSGWCFHTFDFSNPFRELTFRRFSEGLEPPTSFSCELSTGSFASSQDFAPPEVCPLVRRQVDTKFSCFEASGDCWLPYLPVFWAPDDENRRRN